MVEIKWSTNKITNLRDGEILITDPTEMATHVVA